MFLQYQKYYRNIYETALTLQAVNALRGCETEIIEINSQLFRVRKGRRMVMLKRIAKELRTGQEIHVKVLSEEVYHAEVDAMLEARRRNGIESGNYQRDVEDWTHA